MALSDWGHKHLLGIDGLSPAELSGVLDRADGIMNAWAETRDARKSTSLRGRTVINLFFEASTRTRSSFEIAGKRLGADVVNVSPSTSSVTKGETLLDTVRNIEAMRADVIVVRHPASGAPHFIAGRTRASVVNAGDGTHEHPTQALLDALTIRRKVGTIAGLTVAICGDILHSRVARSDAILLTKLGASVRFCAPRTMMPLQAGAIAPVTLAHRIDEAVEGADVVMMLRIQNERLNGAMVSTTREYSRTFGLNARVLAKAKPGALIMHPGPINRGVELDTVLADGPRSVILDQVEAGVAVRAAVLELVSQANEAA
jgi:aspartate carbamoyltransferase catalytic subunit